MPDVQRQQPNGQDVEDGDQGTAEAEVHHRPDVVDLGAGGDNRDAEQMEIRTHHILIQIGLEAGTFHCADREMQDVVDDESCHHPTAQAHVTGGHRGGQPLAHTISLGTTGRPAFECQGDRRPAMDDDTGQEPQTYHPQHGSQRLQEMGIAVDLVGMGEDLQVTYQMAGYKSQEDHSRDCHEKFASY